MCSVAAMARSVKLNTGALMPIIGLGTYKIRGPDVHRSLDAALTAGYRSIDTASVYRNEAEIATSLKTLLPKHNLTRGDIFITSKLGPKDQGAECRKAALRSLENLSTDYLDLYLIHWPGTQGMKPDDPHQPANRRESWTQMEQLHKEGKLRAIGVSNYSLDHMKELFSYCTVPPAVLQTEYQPHLQLHSLVDFCRSKDVHFQAYSSLGTSDPERKFKVRADFNFFTLQKLLNDETVKQVAAECGKTPAQVLLRWTVQQNLGVLPKSTNTDHIKDNMNIFDFEISDEQMKILSAQNRDLHYAWNPVNIL